ncbi:MAG: threonylcarbamoyl-AMP synthase [Gammaproteobacteria bacterium]|nr:threonylcarbamoyl-AMP synthase [Gammaproteobacteria bacterium]
MSQDLINSINKAVVELKLGRLIAYPTEAVFGLGCDPFNIDGVTHLLQLKNRRQEKGFILVAANFEQLEELVEPLPPPQLSQVLNSWPGPTTWVFPATQQVPHLIRGPHNSIAVRVSDHPVVQQLCQGFGGPIISTSANLEGAPPLRDTRSVQLAFADKVDFIVEGEVGQQKSPSEIRDAITNEVLRAG